MLMMLIAGNSCLFNAFNTLVCSYLVDSSFGYFLSWQGIRFDVSLSCPP